MACVTQRVFPDPEPRHNLLALWLNTQPEQRNEQFWSCKETAHKLGLSVGHVRNLADQGKLPGAFKPRGQWVIHFPTLIVSMESHN